MGVKYYYHSILKKISHQETIKKEAYQNVVITEAKEDISNLKSFATKTLLKLPKGGLCDSGEILNFLP